MTSDHILQIFLRVTIQNQIRVAQRIIVDEVIQLRPLRHGHIQRILEMCIRDRVTVGPTCSDSFILRLAGRWYYKRFCLE